MKDLLIAYLENKGCANVRLIGAFFQWTKNGQAGSASYSEIEQEWKKGR